MSGCFSRLTRENSTSALSRDRERHQVQTSLSGDCRTGGTRNETAVPAQAGFPGNGRVVDPARRLRPGPNVMADQNCWDKFRKSPETAEGHRNSEKTGKARKSRGKASRVLNDRCILIPLGDVPKRSDG